MNDVRLPNEIYGKWIWKQSLLNHPDGFALLRREFSCSRIGEDVTMWVTAVNCYQLFLNGRLVGFGPRAHQIGNAVFIDQFSLGDYVENGVNVITVFVTCPQNNGEQKRKPGFWCQLSAGGKDILCSDEKWLIRDGSEFCSNRPRFSRDGGLTNTVNADKLPLGWQLPMFTPDTSWVAPDYIVPVGETGLMMELHPLPPPVILPEHPELKIVESGRVRQLPKFTQVLFKEAPGDGSCYAGMGFLFCERPLKCQIKLFSDDPFKFFCGKELICKGDWSDGSELHPVSFRAGWNKLIFYQTPRCNGMGATIVFTGENIGEINVRQDTLFESPEGWLVFGPLKMVLDECIAGCNIDGVPRTIVRRSAADVVDPGDLIREAKIVPDSSATLKVMHSGDYRIYQLDALRYGFVRVEFVAQAGDMIDFIVGVRRGGNGFVRANRGVRGCSTFNCRDGLNIFCSSTPVDCCYLGIAIRRSKEGVTVNRVIFEELSRSDETLVEDFKCSDEELNTFWQTGKQTLRRNAAFIPVAESGSGNDCSMLDAYIDSMNMAAVFGDADYIAFKLRRFISKQYESGEIPQLTFGHRRRRQLSQMFFLPGWINYNYNFSSNRVEFERALECLNRAREFFETLIDPRMEVLTRLHERFGIDDPMLAGMADDDISTELNSLFCRFLLSAAETYQLAADETLVRHCRRLANRIAARLHETNYDEESKLFFDRKRESAGAEITVSANFYAMFSGVMPTEDFENFFFSFFTLEPPFNRCGEISPYFQFHLLEMLFSLGQRQWAMGYFREYWKERLNDVGGTWTKPGESDPAPTQFCGGGSVSPNIFILREVLGIRIAEPGHAVVYFNPAFREVSFAEGVVPMAKGKLMVRWEVQPGGALDVTLNSTVPIKVVPELSAKRLAVTTFRLSDQVTLLACDGIEDDDSDIVEEQ